jgi:hypothetical protein
MPGWSEFIQVGTSAVWLNTTKILQVVGNSCTLPSGNMAVYFYEGNSHNFPDPLCVTFYALQAKAVKLAN